MNLTKEGDSFSAGEGSGQEAVARRSVREEGLVLCMEEGSTTAQPTLVTHR